MNEKNIESDDIFVQDLKDSLGSTLDETFEMFDKLQDSIELSSLDVEIKKETLGTIESLKTQLKLSTVKVNSQDKLRINEEE
jgi:translation initiation factor IF-2